MAKRYSSDPKTRAAELVAEGKIGGRRQGAGRPRKGVTERQRKRASTVITEYASENADRIAGVLLDVLLADDATRTEKMPWARRTNGQPIYLDVNDAFANSLGGEVQVRVVYFDQGTGQWSLIADGRNVLTVSKSGSNVWREAFVTVSPGALNLALDPMSDGDDIFHLVEITR